MHVQEYFKPSTLQPDVDTAALIVALASNRESPTRTDYAHPRIKEIVQILHDLCRGRNSQGAGPPLAAPPSRGH